ncbi:MAG: type II and III secretion system protein [Endomicrobium sp.]|jgi:pilus assembly protein CpaC|nr:type II and III secretion system protein [Endomicrobium sp.]MDR2398940.1 type II and III secretion system protein [Endomicrobium sp.]
MKKLFVFAVLFCTPSVYGAEQMIEISVEVTEMYENKAKNLGLEFPDSINISEFNIPSILESGSWGRDTKFSSTLKALEENGAAKVLSQPKLVTKSGASANFMVGGEIPIVATGVGSSYVQWKKYGIIMSIKITISKDGKIDIVIETELSRIDHSIQVAGYPAIKKRKVSSHLQIKDGDTVALAGLIETTKTKTRKGIPFLCNVPVLGLLFGVTRYNEEKTNVIIFVTTKLIK